MKKQHEERLYDKRLIDRHIQKGIVDASEYETFLSKLPDLEKEIEVLDVALEPIGDLSSSS